MGACCRNGWADTPEYALNGANLRDAYLWSTILSGADLERANLEGANLAYAYMIDVILCNTTMPDGSVIYSGC